MLQCKVEKSENLLFSKAEEKDNLQKRVLYVCVYTVHMFM